MASPTTRDLLRAQMENYGVPSPIVDDNTSWFDPQERLNLEAYRADQRRRMALQSVADVTAPVGGRMVGAGPYQHYVPDIGGKIGLVAKYYMDKGIQQEADKKELADFLKGEKERQKSFKRARGELLTQQPSTSLPQTSTLPPSGYAPDNSGANTRDIGIAPRAEPVGVSLRKTIAAMDPTEGAATQGYSPAPLPQGEDLGSDPNFQRPMMEDSDSEYPPDSGEAQGQTSDEHESGETLPYLEEESEPDDSSPDEPDQVDTEGQYDVAQQAGGDTGDGQEQPTVRQSLNQTMMGLRGGAADAGGYIRDPRKEAARYNQQYEWGPANPNYPEDISADPADVTGDIPQETAPPPPAQQAPQQAAPTKSIPFQMPADRSNAYLEMAYRFPSLRGALNNAYASELANQHKLQQIALKSSQGLRGGQRYMNTGKGTIFDMQEGKEISLGAFTNRMEQEADIKSELQDQRSAAVLELQKRKEAEAATTRAEKARLTEEADKLARERMASQERITKMQAGAKSAGKEEGYDQPITQNQLLQGTHNLSKDMKDLAPLGRTMGDLTTILSSYPPGANIPGIGLAGSYTGRLKDEAVRNRSAVAAVANAWLKKNSGTAVTESEMGRTIQRMATGDTYTQSQFMAVYPYLLREFNAGVQAARGGYHPRVREAWEKQSGLSLEELKPPRYQEKEKNGASTEEPTIDDLRKKYR